MTPPPTTDPSPVGNPAAYRAADLAMKGGITSGVVYPLAVTELSRRFTFVSIGGTSAGAIAAALTAAAEYRRRHGSAAGFEELERLPEELAQPGFILKLFRPDRRTSGLFGLATAVIGRKSTAGKVVGAAAAAVRHWPSVSLGALPGLALGAVGAWRAALRDSPLLIAIAVIAGLLLAVAGFLILLARAATRELRAARDLGVGLCTGHGEVPPGAPPRLTDWLSQKIDQIAGVTDRPLTFGDLWSAPVPRALAERVPGLIDRSIELRTVTTCLSQGRPYVVPFEVRTFFFLEREMRRLFPAPVVDWMVKTARPTNGDVRTPGGETLLALPEPKDLPVIIAARMSLSFPGLITAVPLWAFDYELPADENGRRTAHRAWFSDGGITSNFPMHFFDAPVPRWPTFGLNLRYFPADSTVPCRSRDLPRVHLPARNSDGAAESWCHLSPGESAPSFPALLKLIQSSMQSWHDNSFLRLPGYRDRVAEIWLTPEQGGMNLDMGPDVVEDLAELGRAAGQELSRRFSEPHSADNPMSWANHRVRRSHAGLAALHEILSDVAEAVRQPVNDDESLITLLTPGARPVEPAAIHKLPDAASLAIQEICALADKLDSLMPFDKPPRPAADLKTKAPM